MTRAAVLNGGGRREANGNSACLVMYPRVHGEEKKRIRQTAAYAVRSLSDSGEQRGGLGETCPLESLGRGGGGEDDGGRQVGEGGGGGGRR